MTDKPEWWPAGVDESKVRECNCPNCKAMIDALEDYRNGISPDGEHKHLEAFGE